MDIMQEGLEHKDLEGDAATLREKYQKDFENLKVLQHHLIFKAVEGQALLCCRGVAGSGRQGSRVEPRHGSRL